MFATVLGLALAGVHTNPFDDALAAAASNALRQIRAAAGGRWQRDARALVVDGTLRSNGLAGTYRAVIALPANRYRWNARLGPFSIAAGVDGYGAWRTDFSGASHRLNSPEGAAAGITEAYLARRGYLQDEPGVGVRLAAAATDPGRTHDVVIVTPPGGRAAMLWERKRDGFIDRASFVRGTKTETIRYRDYRPVGRRMLPFRIEVDDGDEPETGVVSVRAYRPIVSVPRRAFDVPAPPADVAFGAGSGAARVPLRIDERSRFPIVLAQVNAGPAMPFILDTGGHDIVTPEAARRLGLRPIGEGVSSGAGAGVTKTRFVRVRSVRIGTATIRDQPFTVLYIDLGRAEIAPGHDEPVAGILGLEVFERFTVALDFEAGWMTLRPPSTRLASRGAFPLRFTSDLPIVTAALDGIAGQFGLDTGNNADLIVFAPWLRARGISVDTARANALSGSSVGGNLELQGGRVARFTLGPATLRDVPVFVSNMTAGSLSSRVEAGNIGTSIVSRLGRTTFDYARSRVTFETR